MMQYIIYILAFLLLPCPSAVAARAQKAERKLWKSEVPRQKSKGKVAKKQRRAPAAKPAKPAPAKILPKVAPPPEKKPVEVVPVEEAKETEQEPTGPEKEVPPVDEEGTTTGDGRWLNFSLGVNYIFPTAALTVHIYRHLALSASASYFSFSTDFAKFVGYEWQGALHYFSDPSFSGTWIRLGYGKGKITLKSTSGEETLDTPTLLGSFGWRWTGSAGINFGFAIGFQYWTRPRGQTENGVSGLFPVLQLDLGFSF